MHQNAQRIHLSVVTVVRNGALTIRKSLESVANQKYGSDFIIEHVIIDGSSVDNTLEICREFNTCIFAQEGAGIYTAMNQALDVCKGEYVIFLNADDYFEENCISNIEKALNTNANIDMHYFSIKMHSLSGKTTVWNPKLTILRKYAMPAPHPGMVGRVEFIKEIGGFSEKLRFSADYDFALRAIKLGSAALHSEVTTNFVLGGASSSVASLLENNKVRRLNKLTLLNVALGFISDTKRLIN